MAIEAATVIRMASGIMFVGAGLIVALATRQGRDRRAPNLALSIGLASWGLGFISFNLTQFDADRVAMGALIESSLMVVALAGLVTYILKGPLRAHLGPASLIV